MKQPRHWASAFGRRPHGEAVTSGWTGCRPHRGGIAGATSSARGAPPPPAFVLLLTILVRAAWLFIGLQQPSSDDLQYALMAEAIRHHEAFPLVAWGIGYGGTITTSWVLAGLFILFGSSLAVVLTYGAALSLVQLVLWMKIAKQLHPGSEGWVGLLFAVPSAHLGVMMQQP